MEVARQRRVWSSNTEFTMSTGRHRGRALRVLLEWSRFRLAWLAGGDMGLLREVPGEKPFHDRLGGLVLLMTGLSGVAMCYLASVVRGVPMAHVWFVGLVWWLVLVALEPLLLDVVATSGRGLLAVVPLRAIVTLVLAGLFAEALLIGVFKPEIQNVLGQQDVAQVQQTQKHTLAVYEPKIKQAQDAITTIQHREDALKRSNHNEFCSLLKQRRQQPMARKASWISWRRS